MKNICSNLRALSFGTGFALLSVMGSSFAMQFRRVKNVSMEQPHLPGKIVYRSDFVKDALAKTKYPSSDGVVRFLDAAGCAENSESAHLVPDFDPADFIRQEDGNIVLMPKSADGAKIQCGSFKEFSIQELQDACTSIPFPGGGTFNVLEGIDTTMDSWFRYRVDIGALQADPANRDAVFQVASNFNGLETVHAEQSINIQYLESYIDDMTQGPAASISAAPGLIMRRFFMFYDQEQSPIRWIQDSRHQINFLDALPEALPVSRAGYVVFGDPIARGWSVEYRKLVMQADANDYRVMKIGYHANVQVK